MLSGLAMPGFALLQGVSAGQYAGGSHKTGEFSKSASIKWFARILNYRK
jgi:hypothetical protein